MKKRLVSLALLSGFIGAAQVGSVMAPQKPKFSGPFIQVMGGGALLNTSLTTFETATKKNESLFWNQNAAKTSIKPTVGLKSGYMWQRNRFLFGVSGYGTYATFFFKTSDVSEGVAQKGENQVSHIADFGALLEGGVQLNHWSLLGKAGVEMGLFGVRTTFPDPAYKRLQYTNKKAYLLKFAPVVGFGVSRLFETSGGRRFTVGLTHLSSFYRGVNKTFSDEPAVARAFTQKTKGLYKGSIALSLGIIL
jgi:hypothetical protein